MRLCARGVGHCFGDRVVLRDIDVGVEVGETVAIVGANGAGKSTLLGILAGIIAPRSGSVTWGGTRLGDFPPRVRARSIALVPQDVSVPFDYTVEEIVDLGRLPQRSALGGDPEGPGVVRRAIDLLGLGPFLHQPFASLSGGERRRALLALAFAQISTTPGPRVLLLDEPTAHLDLGHQRALMEDLVTRAGAEGITIVTVLHDLALAALYFPRLMVLHAGRLITDGTPQAVLTEATIETIYGTGFSIERHASSEIPRVAIVASAPRPRP